MRPRVPQDRRSDQIPMGETNAVAGDRGKGLISGLQILVLRVCPTVNRIGAASIDLLGTRTLHRFTNNTQLLRELGKRSSLEGWVTLENTGGATTSWSFSKFRDDREKEVLKTG